jgi:hypothetical protein
MKRGTRHRATLLIESMSDDDRAAIVAKIIGQAKRGDRASQKLNFRQDRAAAQRPSGAVRAATDQNHGRRRNRTGGRY